MIDKEKEKSLTNKRDYLKRCVQRNEEIVANDRSKLRILEAYRIELDNAEKDLKTFRDAPQAILFDTSEFKVRRDEWLNR